MITQDMMYGIYRIHFLRTEKIGSQTVSLPDIAPKYDATARIDFGLNLYYLQHGIQGYYNADGKGKFLQFAEESDIIDARLQFVLQLMDKDSIRFEEFDSKLFEGLKNRKRKIFEIISHCYEFGYPKGNLLYDQIEIILLNHDIIRSCVTTKA